MGEQVAAGFPWGISSVGRAPALQAGGHEFESRILHSMRAAHRICTLKTAYMEIQNDQEEYLDQDIRGNRGSDYSKQTRFEATNRKNADWPTPATLCRRRTQGAARALKSAWSC